MLKYFFIVYALVAVAIFAIFGIPGTKFGQRPFRLFPDMDEQDKVKAQRSSSLFADGMGSRLPAPGTVPSSGDDGVFSVEFGQGRSGYYYTGTEGEYYGTGFPTELGLDEASMKPFIARGQDRYEIFCTPCHGSAGDGKGTVAKNGFTAIRNLHDETLQVASYPDGRLYDVIANGKGLMGSYGASVPVKDRWAIVAYVRALQASRTMDLEKISNEEED